MLGLGYVGCVTAACLADAGNDVIGIDPATEKVDAINNGLTPIVEPGLAELIAKTHEQERISASTEVSRALEADVVFVSVGTPSADSGELDLQYIRSVASQLGSRLRHRSGKPVTIVIRSTMLPGTTRNKFIPWLERASGLREGDDFYVAFCPEFLRESTAIQDFANPPFTVIGTESEGAETAAIELLAFVEAPVHVVPSGVAESLKYASNAFHAVKVAFANELARVCIAGDVDAREVMTLFVQDRQLNVSERYLRPGFAFGGSCLPKDVKALQHHARRSGVSAPLIDSLSMTNEAHIDRVVDAVLNAGYRKASQVGLAFKPNTDDLRESPFVKVAARLRHAGVEVIAYDPVIRVERLLGANQNFVNATLPDLDQILVDDISKSLEGAEVILLGTNSADVCEAVLDGPSVPVVDLSGMLPPRVEQALRKRQVPEGGLNAYMGAAW
ncbi:nucleotide sugar dehydrogenase [Mycolicibacterium austroafricanum]|uniref:nucleotide sugar dehydrogenase n=1 Tax=Mycolicibacterium austroafricanum TaxID=39687 RepID=UPI0022A83E4F|nr:nucleotide sugar dehydrogenase [Mycolicibacterium austroafricanum]